jgi:hypothetical protein
MFQGIFIAQDSLTVFADNIMVVLQTRHHDILLMLCVSQEIIGGSPCYMWLSSSWCRFELNKGIF